MGEGAIEGLDGNAANGILAQAPLNACNKADINNGVFTLNASIEFGICAIADTHNASWHRAWRINRIGRSVFVAFNLLISVGMTPMPGTGNKEP